LKVTNNNKPLDKIVHRLAGFENRYPGVVSPVKKNDETELQKLQRFAKLREARATKVNAFGEKHTRAS
jgi:hypothetical protein